MKKIRYLYIPIFIIGLFLTGCDKDVLTEEELLDFGSELSLSIQVVNQNTYFPIDGATVTIGASGKVLTATTDSMGIAHFSGLSQQNSVKVKVNKTGYFNYENFVELNTYSRSTGEHINVYLSSKENAAVIKGVVSIQTDLTTPESEHPEGITIKVLNSSGDIVASTTTDANGEYELEFPSGYYKMEFPDLKFDQTLKVRRASDSTVVATTAKNTIFELYKPADVLPNTSNITATIENPWGQLYGYYWRASVKSITVEAGVITVLEVGYPGQYYYGGWGHQWVVTVNSLNGGSGADIDIDGTYGTTNVRHPLDVNGVNINIGGTGYPVHEPNENVHTMSPTGFTWPGGSYNSELYDSKSLNAESVTIVNINYGTGTTTGMIPIEYL